MDDVGIEAIFENEDMLLNNLGLCDGFNDNETDGGALSEDCCS